ncbi:IS4 family transposase domain protein [Rickettsiales endosymbiont of Paramecium tredecaurelia]|nr:IS4 family transposase domain protein [Candidatus Sarmatiella mevalonica]
MHLRLIQAGRASLEKRGRAKAFANLKPLGYEYSEGILWERKVIIYASKNESGNLMILASCEELEQKAFEKYRHRWAIERLFKHLNSGGFNIEKSHIYQSDQFMKLVAVCAIASAIIIKNGPIQNRLNPIRIRTKKTNPKQL